MDCIYIFYIYIRSFHHLLPRFPFWPLCGTTVEEAVEGVKIIVSKQLEFPEHGSHGFEIRTVHIALSTVFLHCRQSLEKSIIAMSEELLKLWPRMFILDLRLSRDLIRGLGHWRGNHGWTGKGSRSRITSFEQVCNLHKFDVEMWSLKCT